MTLNTTRRNNNSFLSGTMGNINAGLREYMLKVYRLMGLGLLVSAGTAYLGTLPAFMRLLFVATPQGMTYSLFGWVVLLAPLVLVFMFSSAVRKMDASKAQAIFWAFSALMGFSFSAILLTFTAESIFQTFIITAGSFGALCLYGYTTQKDLTGMGAFMAMGLWGLIFAMIINWFMQSSGFAYLISIISVVIFAGLTAYDSQKIRQMYLENQSQQVTDTLAISGALALYLDFINLFITLLRFFGNRK